MTLRLYDDATHQAVPKEPTEAMLVRARTARPFREDDDESSQLDRNSDNTWSAMLSAAPPHGAALPTQAELAKVIGDACYGGVDRPPPWCYAAAGTIRALIREKMKP